MTLTEAEKKFLQYCELLANLSQHTLRAYGSDIDDIRRYLGKIKSIEGVQAGQIREYVRHLREQRRLKEATIKRKLASLKLLFKWALREGVIRTNPFDAVNERIRLPKRLPRALDRGDRESLRKALRLDSRAVDFDEIRRKTAVHLLLDTGIRVGELVSINLADVSLAGGSVLIHGKGNRQRLVYLMQKQLFRKVERYLAHRQRIQTSSDKLLVTGSGSPVHAVGIRAELKGMSQDAGIQRHVTPHMLRHTCATQWLEGGLDIRYVQKLLGHQSISTTEIYTHVSDQGLRDALCRAIEGLGKR